MEPDELAMLEGSERVPLKKRAVRLGLCLVLIAVIVWTCPLGPVFKPSTTRECSPIVVAGYEIGTWTDYGNNQLYSISIGAFPEIYIGNSLTSVLAGIEKLHKGII